MWPNWGHPGQRQRARGWRRTGAEPSGPLWPRPSWFHKEGRPARRAGRAALPISGRVGFGKAGWSGVLESDAGPRRAGPGAGCVRARPQARLRSVQNPSLVLYRSCGGGRVCLGPACASGPEAPQETPAPMPRCKSPNQVPRCAYGKMQGYQKRRASRRTRATQARGARGACTRRAPAAAGATLRGPNNGRERMRLGVGSRGAAQRSAVLRPRACEVYR